MSEAAVVIGGVAVSVESAHDGWTYNVVGPFAGRLLALKGAFAAPKGTTATESLRTLMKALSEIDTSTDTGDIGRWVDQNREALRKGPDGQEG